MAFQSFNENTDIVENQRTTISSGLWTGGSSTLTSFFTQSTREYYKTLTVISRLASR